MEAPTNDMEVVHQKIEEEERGPEFHCDLYDTEMAFKIAEMLLPGLATACVDSTTGDVFKTPASVAVDIRKEFVEYLTQRSETFVAESAIVEGELPAEPPDDPYEIISDFVEDFATLKRNLLGKISGWLLSERREDKIDDIAQEMELTKFWPTERREAVSKVLLKNVDFKGKFHCEMKFNSADELAEHGPSCGFRPMNCDNEGCTVTFVATHLEEHDSVCPFKIIPCEQKCSDNIMRREMDRHCLTVCPMKLVSCPFYQVGCKARVPECTIEQHFKDDIHDHVLHVLQSMHKEASAEYLKRRAEQLQSSSPDELAKARDVRYLTSVVRNLEAKLPQPEIDTQSVPNTDRADTAATAQTNAEGDS